MITIGPETPVKISQIADEFERALALYREVSPKRVLEIGTEAGGTLYHWLKNAEPGARVVSIDVEDQGVPYGEWVPAGVECELIVGDSHAPETVKKAAALGPFDWLFIDGSHIYEDAAEDWLVYRDLCSKFGLVLFHDISLKRAYPETGQVAGVRKLWREIQAQGFTTKEIRTLGMEEYGIGVVYL
jgi:predicted O-methyltransferase YrrM